MPIVFSAIVPHSPLLVPTIGKDKVPKTTQQSMKTLSSHLYACQPESIIIMSPHGQCYQNSCTMNYGQEYIGNFEEFGDHSFQKTFFSDIETIQKIRTESQLSEKQHFFLGSEKKTDYGITVPCFYFLEKAKTIPLIPIAASFTDLKESIEAGKQLKRTISHIQKRFAVIASSDLSHKMTKESPSGYTPKALEFEKKLVRCIKQKNPKKLVALAQQEIEDIEVCGMEVIAMLFGVLEGMNYSVDILSHEYPFGIGYLVAQMNLP